MFLKLSVIVFLFGTIQSLPAEKSTEQDGMPPPLNLTGLTKQLPPPLEGDNISPCYPPGTTGRNQYLVGYGSLMQRASKERTAPRTGESIPVRIYGFTRLWNCKGEDTGFSTTYLGAREGPRDAYLNAVIFRLPSAQALADYDTRESYYCRKEILPSRIQVLSNRAGHRNLGNSQYWIYVTRPEQDAAPSESHPMVSSYVDTFISGCIEQEETYDMPGFAEECVDKTEDWSEHWVNDRIFPRRPFMYQPAAGKIDRLLHEKLPDIYGNIKIEGRR